MLGVQRFDASRVDALGRSFDANVERGGTSKREDCWVEDGEGLLRGVRRGLRGREMDGLMGQRWIWRD